MEIRSVDLENVKSYARETIRFARGTNAICGPNGAGKSTILEAIGFALFDHPPCRPIGHWVREGERIARVTVGLLADDEREYQIVRSCGAQAQHFVYDPELQGRIAETTDGVLRWLREQLGVDDAVDLAALFRDAVGVPQGLLTAAFLETPRRRQEVFNPLLRVEEYNQAFAALLETRHALDGLLQRLEAESAAAQAQVKELPRLEGQAEELSREIAAAETRLQELVRELERLKEERETLARARDRLRQLNDLAARLDERIEGQQGLVRQASEVLAQAQAARRTVDECQAGHRAYLAAQEKREALVAQDQARARIQQALQECLAQEQVTSDRIQRLEQSLQAAIDAAGEAERLRPAAAEQERLERELAQAQVCVQQWQAATTRLQDERARLAELDARLGRLQVGLEERANLEAERETAEQRLEALREALKAAHEEKARHGALLEQLRAQAEALARLEAPQCPVCESDLTPERRTELLERNRRETGLHEQRLAELNSQAAEVTAQGRLLGQSLKALQERLARLPRPAERETAQADHRRQRAAVRQAEQEAARLGGAASLAQALAARLAQMGDPRAACQRALATAARHPALETELAQERERAAQVAGRLAGLRAELAGYGELDEQMATVRAELAAHEPAHRRYLQHERLAQELDQREQTLRELQAGLQAAVEKRQALAQELEAAQSAYRQEEDERLAALHLRASEERSRLEAQAELQRRHLQEAQARIAELRGVSERLQAFQEELSAWQEVGRLLEYLRRVLKEAGPQVTRALVEAISLGASRLYADIVNDHSGRLRWSEDYEILLETGGHRRSFPQLSGGEQMAAALAVRLALLREVSDIDVAFFDEPTSNLDDTRRDNLAGQILGVKGFSQLFVISHDDTFERATDHIVRIAKEDGTSRVTD